MTSQVSTRVYTCFQLFLIAHKVLPQCVIFLSSMLQSLSVIWRAVFTVRLQFKIKQVELINMIYKYLGQSLQQHLQADFFN